MALWTGHQRDAAIGKLRSTAAEKRMQKYVDPDGEAAIEMTCQRIALGKMLLSAYVHVSHGGPTRAEVEDMLQGCGLLPSTRRDVA